MYFFQKINPYKKLFPTPEIPVDQNRSRPSLGSKKKRRSLLEHVQTKNLLNNSMDNSRRSIDHSKFQNDLKELFGFNSPAVSPKSPQLTPDTSINEENDQNDTLELMMEKDVSAIDEVFFNFCIQ